MNENVYNNILHVDLVKACEKLYMDNQEEISNLGDGKFCVVRHETKDGKSIHYVFVDCRVHRAVVLSCDGELVTWLDPSDNLSEQEEEELIDFMNKTFEEGDTGYTSMELE